MRTIFWAFGAFVAQVTDNNIPKCKVWFQSRNEIEDGGFNLSQAVEIDLSKNPAKVDWTGVQIDREEIDDPRFTPYTRYTTIPRDSSNWPSYHPPDKLSAGARVYLKEEYAKGLGLSLPPPGGDGGFDYEFKTVEYHENTSDPRRGLRYFGFHAQIVRKEAGRDLVIIYKAGTGNETTPTAAVTDWLDLTDDLTYDVRPDGLSTIRSSQPVGTAGALFIVEDAAWQWELLEPKLPPGSGERYLRGAVVADCAKLQRPHINVASFDGGGEVRRIKKRLDNEAAVQQSWELKYLIGELTKCQSIPDHPKSLDLIAHSAGSYDLLKLGSWLLDASGADTSWKVLRVFEDLREALQTLGVTELRLLGCRTAIHEKGRQTIAAIEDALDNVKVFGTNDILWLNDYTPAGFKLDRKGKLWKRGDPEPFDKMRLSEIEWPPEAEVVGPLALDKLPSFTEDELPRYQPWPSKALSAPLTGLEKSAFVDANEGRSLPGLLALPLVELRIPATSGGYRRLQVLFDGAMLRVYPNEPPQGDHNRDVISPSACYRVRDKAAFKSMLDDLMLKVST